MPTLGITGGIASGKSTACGMLLERIDADCFDADACARQLLDEDPAVRDQVTAQIHPEAYDTDGRANRQLLRGVVYQDAAKKRVLEAILHPAVRSRWESRAKEANAANRLFVVDIPLLFETKAEALFDRILLVACREDVQLSRLASRRGLDPGISRKIVASQLPLSVKIPKSHHVVWNDGALDGLAAQIELFSRYLHDLYG